jgi:hypothetical protein
MAPVACPSCSVAAYETASVRNLLDSVSVKAQPKNSRDTNAKHSGFQSGGSPCRSLKKAIGKIRNRRRTKTSPRPMCRPTRRRKVWASRRAARSRKRPDARFRRGPWPGGPCHRGCGDGGIQVTRRRLISPDLEADEGIGPERRGLWRRRSHRGLLPAALVNRLRTLRTQFFPLVPQSGMVAVQEKASPE